ncbi:AMP phosphorylase [Candidatus Woesearchaeota archaeon]|nr:AMP phosphorylase [Candidatus Woesearchaeota archaeon]
MKLTVKDMDIATGGVRVVLLNEKDAEKLDLHHNDRVEVRKGKRKTTAVLDIAESSKAVKLGAIGLFEEVLDDLNVKHNDKVEISTGKKPVSVAYIKKKLDGVELNYPETLKIVEDIVNDNLTNIELTSYIAANYVHGMSLKEIIDSTKAMTITGSQIKLKDKLIADVHGIGGVPGNRTTPIVVSILAAAGLKVPKTSSRAITSPSGTADTMDLFCNVGVSIPKLKKILNKAGGFLAWGGAEEINLAPADDKIIQIEHPLEIDAEGQMIASIMAKKASVSATHLLLEISIGKNAKVPTKKEAERLKWYFSKVGKSIGMKITYFIDDGSQPVGNGIGPALEARDVVWLLTNHEKAPKDLCRKSLEMAAQMLEFTGKAGKKQGIKTATEILESGKAYQKFVEIITAQDGKELKPEQIPLGKHTYTVKAPKTGKIKHVDNKITTKIGRMAGAPRDHGSGVYLHVHKRAKVKKGDPLFTIYSQNKEELGYAKEGAKKFKLMEIK